MSTSLNIDKSDPADFDTLLCPRCGCINLHHGAVEIFTRDREDAETGLHVTVTNDMIVDREMSTNPSSRRDGLKISFSCEQCGEDEPLAMELHLIQHKGSTWLYWNVP